MVHGGLSSSVLPKHHSYNSLAAGLRFHAVKQREWWSASAGTIAAQELEMCSQAGQSALRASAWRTDLVRNRSTYMLLEHDGEEYGGRHDVDE